MPTITLYPTNIFSQTASQFTNSSNVLGNTTATATWTGNAQSVVPVMRVGFTWSDVPATATTINSIVFSIIHSSTTSVHLLNVVDVYPGSSTVLNAAMPTTLTQRDTNAWFSMPTVSTLRSWTNTNKEVTWQYTGNASGTITVQKAFVTIDYTEGAAGNNVLFFGENF